MKKIFIFAAAAAMFASCSQDVLTDINSVSNGEKAIGFSTWANKVTRAENSGAENKSALENYHQTMRIWGYKNIMNLGGANYTSTPVFNATKDADLYASSVATWSGAGNVDPFTADDDWVYSPLRYWDKTATNYDFHAASPDKDFADVVIDWKWIQAMDDASTWNSATADAKGAGHFELESFTLNGESLPINKEVTGQTGDVFGKGTTKDVDLMIAEDVTEYTNFPTTSHVHFDFDHILSRLNIGVRTTVPYNTTNGTGVVILKTVKVFNLKNSGAFDESKDKDATLAAGTVARWTPTESKYTVGYPNTEVPVLTNTNANGLCLSMDLAEGAVSASSPALPFADYKYVFQGLILPQEVTYKKLAVDGSDLTEASDIYLEITYNIDGEDFRAVYGLADIFTSNIQYKDAQGRAAYKTWTDDTYVFVDGTNYFDKDGNQYDNNNIAFFNQGNGTFSKINDAPLYEHDGKLYTDPANFAPENEFACSVIILRDASLNKVPVMSSEVEGAKNVKFCEGWQNNLMITIDPKAILFDADVYEWDTYLEATEVVE